MSVFGNYGVEVILKQEDDFLKIRETLTRIGIATFDPEKVNYKGKGLIQTAHILHKQGSYAIVHFKELFKLDGKDSFASIDAEGNKIIKKTTITNDDLARRNTISFLLQEWGLLKIKFPDAISENCAPMAKIKIISHKEKDEWELISKHSLGKRRK